MAVNILEGKIFYVSVKDLLLLVQTFCFMEMFLAIETCFIIVEDYANHFLASLNVHIFYKKNKAPTLPSSFNRLHSIFSISEPNNCICDKFISKVVKNQAVYMSAAKIKETYYNYWLANDMAVLMIDQEFLLIQY